MTVGKNRQEVKKEDTSEENGGANIWSWKSTVSYFMVSGVVFQDPREVKKKSTSFDQFSMWYKSIKISKNIRNAFGSWTG
jgi:hypothetical protein